MRYRHLHQYTQPHSRPHRLFHSTAKKIQMNEWENEKKTTRDDDDAVEKEVSNDVHFSTKTITYFLWLLDFDDELMPVDIVSA